MKITGEMRILSARHSQAETFIAAEEAEADRPEMICLYNETRELYMGVGTRLTARGGSIAESLYSPKDHR